MGTLKKPASRKKSTESVNDPPVWNQGDIVGLQLHLSNLDGTSDVVTIS
jgi:hypothetical protein